MKYLIKGYIYKFKTLKLKLKENNTMQYLTIYQDI